MARRRTDPTGVRLTRYIPHIPHPPQQAFMWLDCPEALYGGAAGGGKSDALLMAALQYVDVPDYSALLLRRTYAELDESGAIMERSHHWLRGTDARWDGTGKRWTFPSGAKLSFGYLASSADKYRYQSAEYQYVAFDELTQFDEADYRYLFSRQRRASEGPLAQVPVRMRAATNPGGRGHRWVKARFLDKTVDPSDPKDTPERAAARIFIPAKLGDNPSVDRADYERRLDMMDPQTRAQLADGDWNAREPGDWVYDQAGIDAAERLGTEYDGRLAAGTMFPPADGELVLGIDWGIGQTFALVGWPLAGGGIYLPPGEVAASRGEPASLTRRMLEAAAVYDFPLGEARYDSAGRQQMETFAANSPAEVGIWKVAFSARKAKTIGYLRRLFDRTAKGLDHQVIAISPRNDTLLDQLRGLKFADPQTGRIDKVDDHGPDALVALASPIANRYAEEMVGSGS